jgi:hypothetical protein
MCGFQKSACECCTVPISVLTNDFQKWLSLLVNTPCTPFFFSFLSLYFDPHHLFSHGSVPQKALKGDYSSGKS